METKEKIQTEAGNTLLNKGYRFKLPFYFWIKIPMTVRPQRPGTITKISLEVLKLKKVNESENMIQELLKAGTNERIFSRIVALGVLNNPIKIFLFCRLYTWIVAWKVKDNKELAAYVSLVFKQMDSERFFFIMMLTQGMNFLERKETNPESKKAETAFGEH